MFNRLLLLAMFISCAAAFGYSQQSGGKTILPVRPTDPTNGKQMYVNYCAPCHGTDGRGHGPVSPALRIPPTDLTALSSEHHGKFPGARVIAVLQFGTSAPAHGTAEMPVWGPILGNMNHVNPQERALRIANLSRYLESLQTR